MINYKFLLISTFCTVLVYFVFAHYFSLFDVKSVALGLGLSICNFYVILWAWSRIFLKKTIALALSVIVFKYAILGLILYKAINSNIYHDISLMFGLSAVVILIISMTLTRSLNKTATGAL